MPGNLTDPLEPGVTPDGEIKPEARDRVMQELRLHFRPEFLNRVDDVVLFKALTPAEIERIVELMFDDLRLRLADRRITLEVGDEARRFIPREGYDPAFGARPLRRYIAREVETRIGRALLTGEVSDGAVIRVELDHGELVVRWQNPAEGASSSDAADDEELVNA